MANLVIKPASGSGNKVVFQNQAGNVDAITVEDSGTIALGTVTSGNISNTAIVYPDGHLLQAESAVYTSFMTVASGTWTDIDSNFYVDITPASASNKVYVSGFWNGCPGGGNQTPLLRLVRIINSTQATIAKGDNYGSVTDASNGGCCIFGNFDNNNSTMANAAFSWLDSPGTDLVIRYKLQVRSEGASYTTYTNRRHTHQDSNNNSWMTPCSLTCMEVQG